MRGPFNGHPRRLRSSEACGRKHLSSLLVMLFVLWTTGFTRSVIAEGAPGSTEALPPHVRVLTITDVLAVADEAPEVVVARAGERAAEAGIDVASALSSPALSLGSHSITARKSISISSPIRYAGQKSAAREAARGDLAVAISSKELARASARRSLRIGWFALAVAEQRARIAAESAARAARNSDAVKALFDAGRAARVDAARAESEALLAAGEKEAAEQSVETAVSELGILIGRAPGEPMKTSGETPAPSQEGPLEDWLARAIASSPEVRVQEQRALAARKRLDLAHRQHLPGLAFEVGADFDDPTQPGVDKFAGATLTFPMDGSARVRLASFEFDRETLELDRVKRSATADVESAWHSAIAARIKFENLDKAALPVAREAAELTLLGYQEGRLDLFRLLDAERALSQNEEAKWEAYLAWGTAHANLLWSAGVDE